MAEEHIMLEINDYSDSKIGVCREAHTLDTEPLSQLKLPDVITSGLNPKPEPDMQAKELNKLPQDKVNKISPKPAMKATPPNSVPITADSKKENEQVKPKSPLPVIKASSTNSVPNIHRLSAKLPIKNIRYEGKKSAELIVCMKTHRRTPLMQMGGKLNR